MDGSYKNAVNRFVEVMEILGGLGLALPGMLRVRTELTPLADASLVIIMIGVVVVTIQTMGFAMLQCRL
jgi:hypothetical protein